MIVSARVARVRMALTGAAFGAVLVAGAACSKKSEATCGAAPDRCAGMMAIVDTHQAHVELVPDGAGGAYAALLGAGDSEICVAGQVCHGALLRLGADGAVLWKLAVGYAVDMPMPLEDGGVAWRGNDGGLHAANGDGTPRWDAPLGDPKLVAVPDAGSIVAVAGGSVARVDAATGQSAWTVPFGLEAPAIPVALPDASVVVAGYTGTNGEFRRVDYADGSTRFDVSLRATLSAPTVVTRWPFGPFLFVSDRLSLRDWNGRESWGNDATEGWRFAFGVEDGWIANGPFQQRVTRFRSNGTALWSVPVAAPVVWVASAPDGSVLLGRNDGTLDKLRASDGLQLWEYGGIAGVKAMTPPKFASTGNVVFAGANVGAASDTHLTTATLAGQQIERWDAGARIVSFVLTGNDDVWLATTEGKLYLRRGASL